MTHRLPTREAAFTLIELMIAIAIISILATMAVPMYVATMEVSETTAAHADIKNIAQAIDLYILSHGFPPDSLADVGMDGMRDPWGNPYEYLKLDLDEEEDDGKGKGKGKVKVEGGKPRKDHNLHPINTDYDLYSMGPDGKTTAPLTANISQDDIIRAQNGNYFGVASGY